MEELKQLIREVPDFPKPGIRFYDITTLMKNAQGLRRVIDEFHHRYADQKIDVVVGIEARDTSLHRPSLWLLAQVLFRSVSRRNCPAKSSSGSMNSSTVRTGWRSIGMPLRAVSAC